MSTKTKPKPCVMWAIYSLPFDNGNGISAHPSKSCADCYSWKDGSDVIIPVAVIPLSDVEAIVERAAKASAIHCGYTNAQWMYLSEGFKDAYRSEARAALTAAGIPCALRNPREKKKCWYRRLLDRTAALPRVDAKPAKQRRARK